jgi:hypothetical protein
MNHTYNFPKSYLKRAALKKKKKTGVVIFTEKGQGQGRPTGGN